MSRRIDAHHHLWRYSAEEYGWIDGTMTPLKRDYMPGDFLEVMATAAIDGTIAVQARQDLAETHDLILLAEKNSFIEAGEGRAPTASDEITSGLAPPASDPK